MAIAPGTEEPAASSQGFTNPRSLAGWESQKVFKLGCKLGWGGGAGSLGRSWGLPREPAGGGGAAGAAGAAKLTERRLEPRGAVGAWGGGGGKGRSSLGISSSVWRRPGRAVSMAV